MKRIMPRRPHVVRAGERGDAQLAAAGIGERLPAFTDRTGWFDWAAELLPSFSRRAVELEEQIRSAPLGSDLSLGMLRSKQWLETSAGGSRR